MIQNSLPSAGSSRGDQWGIQTDKNGNRRRVRSHEPRAKHRYRRGRGRPRLVLCGSGRRQRQREGPLKNRRLYSPRPASCSQTIAYRSARSISCIVTAPVFGSSHFGSTFPQPNLMRVSSVLPRNAKIRKLLFLNNLLLIPRFPYGSSKGERLD
jgi:hypothetical protein